MTDARTTRPFAEEVRRLAAERRLSLRQLAAEAEIDHGFLVRVLQGKKPLNENVLLRVTKALGLPEDYFLEERREQIVHSMKRLPWLVDELYEVKVKRDPGPGRS